MAATAFEQIDLQGFHYEYQYPQRKSQFGRILIWGLDKNSQNHLIRIEDYPIHCYIELEPIDYNGRRITWTDMRVNLLFKYFQRRMEKSNDGPINFRVYKKTTLYYYQGDNQKLFLKLFFCNPDAVRHFSNIATKINEVYYDGVRLGKLKFTVFDQRIDPIRKFLTDLNCNYAEWTSFQGIHPVDPKKLSLVEDQLSLERKDIFHSISVFPRNREWIVSWTKVKPTDKEVCAQWTTSPKLFSFDIETYSHDRRSFPDMHDARDVPFMISVVYQRFQQPETRKQWCIVYGKVNQVDEDAEIINVSTPLKMVDQMADLMEQLDPDIIIGYNILGFDYPYLDHRLKMRLQGWPQKMSRLLDTEIELKNKTWASSGYGHNDLHMLEIPGRISIDMLVVIRRDYKLKQYNLDFVSKYFLGRGKLPVTAQQMFLAFERMRLGIKEYAKHFHSIKFETKKERKELCRYLASRKAIVYQSLKEKTLELEKNENNEKGEVTLESINDPALGSIYDKNGDLNWCSTRLWRLLLNHGEELVARVDKEDPSMTRPFDPRAIALLQVGIFFMDRIANYCIIDSVRCVDLFDDRMTWFDLTEQSSAAAVTINDLTTRGQQIRTLSLLYDYLTKRDFIMDKRESPELSYEGGFVFDAVPGVYDAVFCLDFHSLYPNIMITYNLCYSTLLRPGTFPELTDDDVHTIKVPMLGTEEAEDYDIEEKDKKKFSQAMANVETDGEGNYVTKFVKPKIKGGVLPRILEELIARRNQVKREKALFTPDNPNWMIREKRQLAIKVTANSVYGFTGASKRGRLPILEVAMVTTCLGRISVKKLNQYVIDEFGAVPVYGDTDSVMFRIPDLPSEKYGEMGKLLEKKTTEQFPGTLELEMEKIMRMVLICKKKYAYYEYDDQGNLKLDKNGIPIINNKGNVTKRRETPSWLARVYSHSLHFILDGRSLRETLDYLINEVKRLMEGRVEYSELISTISVNSSYKDPNYRTKLFADNLRAYGRPVNAGERIAFLITDKAYLLDGKDNKYLGNKYVTPEIFAEYLDTEKPMKIDYLYYLQHLFTNNIDDLLTAGYRQELKKYQAIKFLPTSRHRKYIPLGNFMTMMGRMYQFEVNPDEILKDVDRIDRGEEAQLHRIKGIHPSARRPKKTDSSASFVAPPSVRKKRRVVLRLK